MSTGGAPRTPPLTSTASQLLPRIHNIHSSANLDFIDGKSSLPRLYSWAAIVKLSLLVLGGGWEGTLSLLVHTSPVLDGWMAGDYFI